MLKVHLNFHIAGHFIREPFIIIIIRQSTALRDDYIVRKFENTLPSQKNKPRFNRELTEKNNQK